MTRRFQLFFVFAMIALGVSFLPLGSASAADTTIPLTPLQQSVSGPRNTTGSVENFYISPSGFVPAKMPAGTVAVMEITLLSDQYAGTWDGGAPVGSIFDFGVTFNPATYNQPNPTSDPNIGAKTRDGFAFQDNSNGFGYCWDDYETVNTSGFGAAQCGVPDGIGGSLTHFKLTIHPDGTFEMVETNLHPDGSFMSSQTDSETLRAFDPARTLYPYIRNRVGSDTDAAWHWETSAATLTVDSAALLGTPEPPQPLCVDTPSIAGSVVRAGGVEQTIGQVVFCRTLYSPEQIGNEALVNMGVQHAVDVYSTALSYFNNGIVICLAGEGQLAWLPASTLPRQVQLIGSYVVPEFPNFTCATLFEPGTLVILNKN